MEGGKDGIVLHRSEFSDFVVKAASQYFRELDLPPAQKSRLEEMVIIPFGSVVRGNASELSSDLDLILVEVDPANYDQPIMPFTDGGYHKDKISLGTYLLSKYAENHQDIKERRKGCVRPEYVEEIEVDNPHPLVDELIDAIDSNTLVLEEEGVTQSGGHSSAVLLGLILNINPELVIAGRPELLREIQDRIREHLEGRLEAQKLIDNQYNHFIQWKKTEED